jgi:hypothetical protein
MSATRAISLAAACLATTSAFALEQGDYRFNGFGTAAITHLGGDEHVYGIQGQTNDSWRGDQLSKLGGQFQYGLTDTLSVTAQGVARAEQDSWKPKLEWLYLAWQADDNLTLRAGRLRTPAYMYSETLDVGFTYPWLRLPDEVYSAMPLSNFEGADALFSHALPFGAVNFQVGGGVANNRDLFAAGELHDVDAKNVFGTAVSLATNDFGTFRVSYVEADLHINVAPTVSTPLGPLRIQATNLEGNKARFASVGYQYDNGTWVTADEWTTRNIENNNNPSVESFYLMGGRRFGEFLAHVTYAQMDDVAGRQSSWSYGLNYNLMPTVVLKSEYKRVETQGNYPGVFSRTAQESFDNNVGLAPDRNYDGDIISVGIDFVF